MISRLCEQEALKGDKKMPESIRCYVCLDSDTAIDVVQYDKAPVSTPRLLTDYIGSSDTAVEQLLVHSDFLPVLKEESSRYSHLVIIGCGEIADRVGIVAAHLSHYPRYSDEAVVLQGSAPVVVGDVGSLLLGSYAVHPVIIVSKTSSGPAHYRHFEGLEGIEHILAVAFDIRHFRVLAYPKSPIDAPSEVLRELSVDFLGNGIAGAFIVNPDSCILRVKSDCAENGNNCRDGF